jgi:hypothetical protein
MAEEQANVAFGAEKQLNASLRFVQQFERSYDEMSKAVPGFDKPGVRGKIGRGIGSIKEFIGEIPETTAMVRRLQPIANQMARDVEGGRVTDQDRAIYANAFANTLSAPSESNARLVSSELISLADKGADISKNLTALAQSNNPVLRQVYAQVIEAYPGLQAQVVKATEPSQQAAMTPEKVLWHRQKAKEAIESGKADARKVATMFKQETGEDL